MISWTGTSFSLALETDADLVLCAVNTLVSNTAKAKSVLSPPRNRVPRYSFMGPNIIINYFVSLLRKAFVLLMYALKQDKGQIVLSGS